jgi:hypothetical protein
MELFFYLYSTTKVKKILFVNIKFKSKKTCLPKKSHLNSVGTPVSAQHAFGDRNFFVVHLCFAYGRKFGVVYMNISLPEKTVVESKAEN